MEKINIAIVDDHPLFRIGFSKYIELSSFVDKIFTFESGESFLSFLKENTVDLVFMDLLMSGINGIVTSQKAKEINSDLKIIALSSMSEIEYVEGMISAGADGYILKTSSNKEIYEAINAIVSGENYFSPSILVALSKSSKSTLR